MSIIPDRVARRFIFTVFLSILFLSAVYSQEWGVDSTTNASLSQPSTTVFTLYERLDPWFKLPIGSAGSSFEGSAHIAPELYVDGINRASFILNGDLDLLKLSFVIPKAGPDLNQFRLDLGRFFFADPTGYVFAHTGDGIGIDADFSSVQISFNAAYTGLLLKNNSSISMSKADSALLAAGNTDPRVFGSSRFVGQAELSFPSILKQSLEFSFLTQKDLNAAVWNPDKPSIFVSPYTQNFRPGLGGTIDTSYANLKIGGPIVDNLFYDVLFSYSFGQTLSWVSDSGSPTGKSYQERPISAFLAGASLRFYVPGFLNSLFTLKFLAASGDKDANSVYEGNTNDLSTEFVPMNNQTLGTAFSPNLSNLVFIQLGGSIKPVASLPLQTGLNLMAFFRATPGPISAPGLLGGSDSDYLGFETDIFGLWRIASDVGLSVTSGFFFPSLDPVGAFDPSFAASKFQYNLVIALTINA